MVLGTDRSRTSQLGYFRGGFQALAEALAAKVATLGGLIQTGVAVQHLAPTDAGWELQTSEGTSTFDRAIVASSPGLLGKIVPDLPSDYTAELKSLKSLGAVVMVVALHQQLLTNGVYWLNLPKGEFPFLALVEHTNLIEREHYGGDYLIYCGDYLPADHRYFTMQPEAVIAEWTAALTKANSAFEPSWIRRAWLNRERYAQPVVPINHSKHLPALRTPLAGLFFASMSQVYPWDRGTNFAVAEDALRSKRRRRRRQTCKIGHLTLDDGDVATSGTFTVRRYDPITDWGRYRLAPVGCLCARIDEWLLCLSRIWTGECATLQARSGS